MSADWRGLVDENDKLRCRVQELEAENDELRQRLAERDQPQRRPISFGEIEHPFGKRYR